MTPGGRPEPHCAETARRSYPGRSFRSGTAWADRWTSCVCARAPSLGTLRQNAPIRATRPIDKGPGPDPPNDPAAKTAGAGPGGAPGGRAGSRGVGAGPPARSGAECICVAGDITLSVVISPAVRARSAPAGRRTGASMPPEPKPANGSGDDARCVRTAGAGLRGVAVAAPVVGADPWPGMLGDVGLGAPTPVAPAPLDEPVAPMEGVEGRPGAGAHVQVQCHCQAPPVTWAMIGPRAEMGGSADELQSSCQSHVQIHGCVAGWSPTGTSATVTGAEKFDGACCTDVAAAAATWPAGRAGRARRHRDRLLNRLLCVRRHRLRSRDVDLRHRAAVAGAEDGHGDVDVRRRDLRRLGDRNGALRGAHGLRGAVPGSRSGCRALHGVDGACVSRRDVLLRDGPGVPGAQHLHRDHDVRGRLLQRRPERVRDLARRGIEPGLRGLPGSGGCATCAAPGESEAGGAGVGADAGAGVGTGAGSPSCAHVGATAGDRPSASAQSGASSHVSPVLRAIRTIAQQLPREPANHPCTEISHTCMAEVYG